MNLLDAIYNRHSVRKYTKEKLKIEAVDILQEKICEVNKVGHLNVQLILNEPKAFKGIFAYGKFENVSNYLVMAGKKANDLDDRVGYYGEQLVLLAQSMGINSCWAGLSYTKIPGTYLLEEGEIIACYIALGYGMTQGCERKSKSPEEVSNATKQTPDWFSRGIDAVLKAPTAVNQQKFFFELIAPQNNQEKYKVLAKRKFSLIGYTQMDLGIAKLHFEIGAGKENFEWL